MMSDNHYAAYAELRKKYWELPEGSEERKLAYRQRVLEDIQRDLRRDAQAFLDDCEPARALEVLDLPLLVER